MYKNKTKAFTLVELIVVITILAILGTIAFINLQGYSVGARDSKRLSDINNIQKKIAVEISKGTNLSSLINLVKTNSGLTINSVSGTSIQGTANFQSLKENGASFKDPITKGDYVLSYSVGGSGTGAYKFIQISTVNEEKNQAVVKGNYYQMQAGDSPSITLNSNDTYFVIDGGSDLPYELVAGGSTLTFTCGDIVSAGGYTYTTILGPDGKCWTNTNMKHGTMLVNGTTMPSDTNTIEKWCYNNSAINCDNEGGLYTWSEAMGFPDSCNTTNCIQSENTYNSVCGQLGAGWHLPSDIEQYNLENSSKNNGQTCDSVRSGMWDCNGAGWSGNKLLGIVSFLPGNVENNGSFNNHFTYGFWWSSTEFSTNFSWYRRLGSSFPTVNRNSYDKVNGFSVVCIKN